MRVSLNGYFLANEHTGSGQYVTHLLQHLRGVEVAVHRPPGLLGNVGKVRWEQSGWPRQARASGADLLHGPYFALPLKRDRPAVVTIHDLIPVILPAYRGSLLVRAYTWLQALACRSAEAILVDSECSRRDVLDRLHVAPERVHVVYLGVDPRYTPDRSGPPPLDRPYVFYIGGMDQRKNVPALLRAFSLVAARRPDLLLAIGGQVPEPGPLFPDVRSLAGALGNRVRFLGAMDEARKVELLRHAELFVAPSLYEGFGLGPLEAMACGCPVASSNASSLPEIVEDAGLLFDPHDERAMADAMLRALDDPEPLRRKGPAQAARFTWERSAEQTAAAYRSALDILP